MSGYTASFTIDKKRSWPLWDNLYHRYLLFYTLLYLSAFAVGCFLFHALDAADSPRMDARILGYFSFGLSDCADAQDGAARLFSASKQDLSHILFLFTAGFTLFAGIASALLLLARGFALGFSVSYLTFALQNGYVVLAAPKADLILYITLSACTAAICIHLAVFSKLFSNGFKKLCGDLRLILTSKALYLHLLRFLTGVGAVLLLNLCRCLL